MEEEEQVEEEQVEEEQGQEQKQEEEHRRGRGIGKDKCLMLHD